MTHLLVVVQTARSASSIYLKHGSQKEKVIEAGESTGPKTIAQPQDEDESLVGERGGGAHRGRYSDEALAEWHRPV